MTPTLLVALLASTPAPEVLVFGGGWGPEGNQASIERDAGRLHRLFPRSTLLFADGARARRTVQTASATDPATRRLGLVFARSDGLAVRYRRTELRPEGPATADAVTRALRRLAARPAGGIAFGVGHGSPAVDNRAAALELWGGPLEVRELAARLDADGAKGPLALVLGQCHSGAFRDLAHVGGDPERELATPARCVLAAVPRELEAAGCSPDQESPDAKAFLHAMADAVEQGADYDGDGATTLDEAFAWARLEDDTVDVPVKSSELYALRAVGEVDLAEVTRPALLAAADAADRAVLEGLVPRLAPKVILGRLEAEIQAAEKLDAQVEGFEAEREEARRTALDQLLDAFPELSNPYHPRARALLSGEAAPLAALWAAEPASIRELESAETKLERASLARWDLEKRIARLDRWVRVARAVWGARRLEGAARKGWARLRACERARLPISAHR